MKPEPLVEEELEDLSPPPVAEPNPGPVQVDDGWDGRSSKFAIAPNRTLVRNGEVLGYRYLCQDCRHRGKEIREHQFHLRTSRVRGRQVGPDREHLAALRADGFVNGSPEAAAYAQKLGKRMDLLGVEAEETCRNPSCGRDLRREDGTFAPVCPNCHSRNGMPELKPPTTEQVARQLERDLAGGQEGRTAREQEQRRQETAELKTALQPVTELAAVIRELLAKNGEGK